MKQRREKREGIRVKAKAHHAIYPFPVNPSPFPI
jgi:hypothetical protein